METTVRALHAALTVPAQPDSVQGVDMDWVRRELVSLLLKYPGGVTEAIAHTHLYAKLQQSTARQALVNVPYLTQAAGKATAAGDGASASTQSTATLSAVAASRALGGGCTEVEVTGLRMHYAGALADRTNEQDGTSAPEGATLELADGSWKGQCTMRLHQRYWRLLAGERAQLGAGTELRFANLKPYRCCKSGAADALLRLLPSEEAVLLASQADLEHCATVQDVASLQQLKVEGGARVIVQDRVLGRVSAIGAVASGCRCALCDASKQAQHRVVTIQRHVASGALAPQLPLILYDKQVALGDLLAEGEVVALDMVAVRALSQAAAQCVAAADSQRPWPPPGPPTLATAALCLEIGPETILWAAKGPLAIPNGAKRMKLGHTSARAGGAGSAASTLLGELLSVRYSKGVSAMGATQAAGSSMASTQSATECPSWLHLLLRVDGVSVEVQVGYSGDRRELLKVARSMRPGHIVMATGAEASSVKAADGKCRVYSLELGPGAAVYSLSGLPGLLASPQLNGAAPGGGRTGEAVQVGPGAVVLARVRVREVHVRVRRAHQHCHRPLVGSSLLEGFFDDDECEGADAMGSESTDVPVSPSRVGPDFRDGLWECRFCDRECGSSEAEAQLVGFVSVTDVATGVDEGAVWLAAEGAALETLVGLSATQFVGLPPADRMELLKAQAGQEAVLSLCRHVGPPNSRLSFCGWVPGDLRAARGPEVPGASHTIHVGAALLV
eukprot:jgi/Tetstr1/454644/TSEL_041535.t2